VLDAHLDTLFEVGQDTLVLLERSVEILQGLLALVDDRVAPSRCDKGLVRFLKKY